MIHLVFICKDMFHGRLNDIMLIYWRSHILTARKIQMLLISSVLLMTLIFNLLNGFFTTYYEIVFTFISIIWFSLSHVSMSTQIQILIAFFKLSLRN